MSILVLAFTVITSCDHCKGYRPFVFLFKFTDICILCCSDEDVAGTGAQCSYAWRGSAIW